MTASPATSAATLTEAERFTFDNSGYLVLENFLQPDHVARLTGALDQVIAHRRGLLAADPARSRLTLVNGPASTRILYILEDDPLFQQLLDWPALLPYVRELIGPKAHYHASDAIVEKAQDFMNRPIGWHIDGHDSGYRNLRRPIPLLQLKVGYYLSDMTEPWRGNLTVVPGSHKTSQNPAPDDLKRRDFFPGAVQVCAPAGTCILFHNAIWHTAAPFNRPEEQRTMLYYAYEHHWMMAAEGHWGYSADFYNRRLTPAQRLYFHGNVFNPPEHRHFF
ncbi:MAG: phytanoyl-CoA dioxygenase [Verrucomicrobia bacterium]|nr:phytanoyl-CoA dioxygenase [Verrucomicrobiota bacterium]